MNEHNPIAKNQVKFMLNDKEVYAHSEQTIWQAAHKQGVEIPHYVIEMMKLTEQTETAVHAWFKSRVNVLLQPHANEKSAMVWS